MLRETTLAVKEVACDSCGKVLADRDGRVFLLLEGEDPQYYAYDWLIAGPMAFCDDAGCCDHDAVCESCGAEGDPVSWGNCDACWTEWARVLRKEAA